GHPSRERRDRAKGDAVRRWHAKAKTRPPCTNERRWQARVQSRLLLIGYAARAAFQADAFSLAGCWHLRLVGATAVDDVAGQGSCPVASLIVTARLLPPARHRRDDL